MADHNPALLENPGDYPVGLAALYRRQLERAIPNPGDYKNKLRPFLRLLCAARRPLPLLLTELILKKDRGFLQGDILPLLGSLTEIRDEAVSPFHKSFTDYLQSEEAADYRIDALSGHEALTRHYYGELANEDGVDYTRLDVYGQTEFTYHFLVCLNGDGDYDGPVEVLGLEDDVVNDDADEILEALDLTRENWEKLRAGFGDVAQTVEGEGQDVGITARAMEWMLLQTALDFKLLGQNDARGATSMNKLADILREMGQYKIARPCMSGRCQSMKKLLARNTRIRQRASTIWLRCYPTWVIMSPPGLCLSGRWQSWKKHGARNTRVRREASTIWPCCYPTRVMMSLPDLCMSARWQSGKKH
ncbi:hypothetical protein AGMMS50256_14720 [Betaproteobacteria bacterium]|nr:hypothetical protein AGMMS50256_14720 [Betaproteobacteria bacterium]